MLLQEAEKSHSCITGITDVAAVTGVTVKHCIDQASDRPAKSSSTKAKSRKKCSYTGDDPRSPAHIPILSATSDDSVTSSTPTATKLSTGSRRVTTGCCVAMSVNKMAKHRRPLSGSYSALVRKKRYLLLLIGLLFSYSH